MVQLDLTPEEKSILVAMLEINLSDLRMEISHTDSQDFRDKLRERKEVIKKVLATLQ